MGFLVPLFFWSPFLSLGKWLHQLAALGVCKDPKPMPSSYGQALACQGRVAQRKTDLRSKPGWLDFALLLF